eukprot:gene818-1594_t
MPLPRPRKRNPTSYYKQSIIYIVFLSIVVIYFIFLRSLFTEIDKDDTNLGAKKHLHKKLHASHVVSIPQKHNLESIFLEGLAPLSYNEVDGLIDDTPIVFSDLFQNERSHIHNTSRVGSSNLMHMLGRHMNIENLGEIFLPELFDSPKLLPKSDSVKKHPANEVLQTKIATYIRRSLSPDRLHGKRGIVNVKFWHAWSNGVSISWLLQTFFEEGDCTHIIFVTRNPVRIAISENFAENEAVRGYSKKSLSPPSCESQRMRYAVSGVKVVEMALDQYRGFREASTVTGLNALGISYEKDILEDPRFAYRKIVKFLNMKDENPDEKFIKGLPCRLSQLLQNYEELFCSLFKWDKLMNIVSLRGALSSSSSFSESLEWMVSDEEDEEYGFENTILSWRALETLRTGLTDENIPQDCTESELEAERYCNN